MSSEYTPKDIHVLIAFDVEDILSNHAPPEQPNLDNPINLDLGEGLIYMIVKHDAVQSGEATGELDINAVVGDTIYWRETTLAADGKYGVFLYKFVATSNGELITESLFHEKHYDRPLINPSNLEVSWQKVKEYVWSCDAEEVGTVTYHFEFGIYENESGKIIGYYDWDPYITIVEPPSN